MNILGHTKNILMDNIFVFLKKKKRLEQNKHLTNNMLKYKNIGILIKHFQKSKVEKEPS